MTSNADTRRARAGELAARWAGPVFVTAVGGLIRFWNLGGPKQLMFDETYYVKDAFALMTHGYEVNWTEDANTGFVIGDMSGMLDTGSYVVHPPLGKWLIGVGMWVGGPESPFSWRLSAAVAGTLLIWVTILVGWRLFKSQPLGLLAGLLVAVDGIAVVMSRTGLLDIFLALFVMLAAWLILKDRAVMDQRLDRLLSTPVGHGPYGAPLYRSRLFGPRLGMRWYLLGAGASLGAACAVKWSGLWFLAVFGLLVVCWDAAARRRRGIEQWLLGAVWLDGVKAFCLTVPVALAVYVSSWSGWLATRGGYYRNWAEYHPNGPFSWLPDGLRSLIHYHREAYSFHVGLTTEHVYESSPFGWLLQLRPTAFMYTYDPTCGADNCRQAVTALGNPLIWWLGVAALLLVVYAAVVWADSRAWFIFAGYLAGYVPWLFYSHRTIFTFYSVSFMPFLALALAYAAGRIIGPAARPRHSQAFRLKALAIALIAVVFVSAFFYPIWSGASISDTYWQMHMWLPAWN
ncbi:MAG: phospholipid carrier-dependent glycosyltransferase [Bifidobacteriaceae bacterium]|nr:phospholipid carrier-dependent glycosyltransferase [Bifidobacteriaceae bacterium]